jgi:hypothetical protein
MQHRSSASHLQPGPVQRRCLTGRTADLSLDPPSNHPNHSASPTPHHEVRALSMETATFQPSPPSLPSCASNPRILDAQDAAASRARHAPIRLFTCGAVSFTTVIRALSDPKTCIRRSAEVGQVRGARSRTSGTCRLMEGTMAVCGLVGVSLLLGCACSNKRTRNEGCGLCHWSQPRARAPCSRPSLPRPYL